MFAKLTTPLLEFLENIYDKVGKRKNRALLRMTVGRLQYMTVISSGFRLYADHVNLIFIFNPLIIVPDLGKAAIKTTFHFAVRFPTNNYTCIHINGSKNI